MLFPVHHRGWELSFLAPSFDIQVVDEDLLAFTASHPFKPWLKFRENGSHPVNKATAIVAVRPGNMPTARPKKTDKSITIKFMG